MKIKKIDSSSNPLFKKLQSLTKSKGIEEHGYCLVSGEKVVAELAQDETEDAFWIFHTEDHDLFDEYPLAQLIVLPKNLFKELDLVGTNAPLLCWAVPPINPWDSGAPLRSHEVLCALGDPNNLGALFRSALAFGIKNIVLLEECCHPFHPKTVKASSGACFNLQFFAGPSIQKLDGVKNILALDGGGKKLSEVGTKGPFRILLGEEGPGIPKNIDCEKVSIPISPEMESLNATVAASVLFYELAKKS